MKTLLLVRHAKSSWDEPGLEDHERPLNERGLRNAPLMGHRLGERGAIPDLIRSSTAVRARSTAQLMARAMGLMHEHVELDERLYGASPETILDIAAEADDAVGTVMIVAHDSGLSDLAYSLSDGESEHMPTCAVAEFRFDAETWREAVESEPVDSRFDTPR